MDEHTHDHVLLDNAARLWIANGSSIMLKVTSAHGDPVEIVADEARELAAVLLQLADELDSSNT